MSTDRLDDIDARTESGELKFKVRYYNEQQSRRGRGVQIRYFESRDEAAEFAATHQLYGGPCKVEVTK